MILQLMSFRYLLEKPMTCCGAIDVKGLGLKRVDEKVTDRRRELVVAGHDIKGCPGGCHVV